MEGQCGEFRGLPEVTKSIKWHSDLLVSSPGFFLPNHAAPLPGSYLQGSAHPADELVCCSDQ